MGLQNHNFSALKLVLRVASLKALLDMLLEKALDANLQRERALEEGAKNLQSNTLVEEFSGMLKRTDYFLHLVLQSTQIVITHQVSLI